MKTLLVVLSLCFITAIAQAQYNSEVTTKGDTPNMYLHITDSVPVIKSYVRPQIYQKWLNELEVCQGIQLSKKVTDDVNFYAILTDQDAFYFNEVGPYIGYAMPWDNKIYLTQKYVFIETVVKHEFTHVLMWHIGNLEDHPKKYFNKRCNTV